jgi:hypothetical protein
MQHKQTATGLAALGRKGDTELVHMTKGEVSGLHALAAAKGGELTINPETGLLEASFLKSIMPMVIGAGLSIASGGTLTPLMAAGLTGGGYALATGSLEKGLMAGLGAYGGAGITSGLVGAGAAEAAGGAMAGAAPTTAAGANMAGVQAAGTNMAGFQTAGAGLQGATSALPAASSGALGSGTFLDPTTLQSLGGGANMFPATTVGAAPAAIGPTGVPVTAAAQLGPTNAAAANMPTRWESLQAGAGKAFDSPGDFLSANKYPLMAGGISAISGMGQEPLNAPETDQGMIRPYTFNRTQTNPTDALGSLYTPGQSTRERNWFEDSYTAGTPYKAPGPEYMANGGPVEAMSNDNTIGANTGYPMSNIQAGEYATPYQQPISRNVVTGSQDAATNPYTGQAQFADGGDVSSSIIGSIFAQNQQDKRPQYVNNSVGGYDYNQATGAFTRSPEVQQPMPGGIQGMLGRAGGMFGGALGGMFDPQGPQFQQPEPDQNSGMMGGMFGSLLNRNQSQSPRYANNSVGGYDYNQGTGQFTQLPAMANGGGISTLGGKSDLGGYSDGGQLLRGPGDGVSDSIPAVIGETQPARLADSEFVIPARIVSELGNGSSEAGSRQLYAMMDRIQKARKKSIGKGKVAVDTKARNHLPA